ncbi:MAG: hypothetical protein ACE5IY_02200 [bacterium]
MARVPKEYHKFFWEVKAEMLDTEEYPEYIIERILEHGTLESVKWLRSTIGDERIRSFVKTRGDRSLSSMTFNFWQLILKLSPEECTRMSSTRRKYSFWKY